MDQELLSLSRELEQQFNHWEHYRDNGGSDPFWPDGFNMNLVRNHIISTKKQIQKLIEHQQSREPSLFSPTYPDIWHKETPPEVPNDLMVKANEIRSHAAQQLKLFLADPNFQYIKQQAKVLYRRGQTQKTKEAGLPYYEVIGLEKYEKAVKDDDLVAMRRDFREPYESLAPRWAKYANQIRTYLESTHDIVLPKQTSKTTSPSTPNSQTTLSNAPSQNDFSQSQVPSPLDSRLQDAAARAAKTDAKPTYKQQEEQLCLF